MATKTTVIAFVGDPNVNVKYLISGGIVKDNTVTFQLGSHNFTSEVDEAGTIGGSAILAAVAANSLAGPDVKVALVSFFGKDRFTPMFEDLLQKEGIVDVYGHQNDKVPNDKTNEMFVPGGGRFFQDKVYARDKVPRYEDMTQAPDHLYLTSVNWPWIPTYQKTIEYAQANDIDVAFAPGASQLNDLSLTPETLSDMKEMHAVYRAVELADIKKAFFDTLRASQHLFVNKAAAVKICAEAGVNSTDVEELVSELQKLGPQTVSITEGDDEAKAGIYMSAIGGRAK